MNVLEELQAHRERRNAGGKMFAGLKQSASGFPRPPEPFKNASLVDGKLVVTGKDPLPEDVKNSTYASLEEAIDHLHRGVEPVNIQTLLKRLEKAEVELAVSKAEINKLNKKQG